MGWADEARRRAAAGRGGFRDGAIPLIGGPKAQPPRDRFGKTLKPGDLVMYRPTQDLVFQVMAIEHASVLGSPGDQIPPGDPLLMVLEIQVPIQCAANGQPMLNIVTIGHMAPATGDPGKAPGDTGDGPPMPTTDQGGAGGLEGAPEALDGAAASTVPGSDDGKALATPEPPEG